MNEKRKQLLLVSESVSQESMSSYRVSERVNAISDFDFGVGNESEDDKRERGGCVDK